MAAKKEPRETREPPESRQPGSPVLRPGFPIVGIGASAGGLDALDSFFSTMPPDAGLGFLVVVHLDPTHVSILPELLQKHTQMPVHQITDGMMVEQNHVYVIPPNKDLSILHGTLTLTNLRQPHGANLPIDRFFRSLAQDQENQAIGIILSGTGSDGSLGVKAIKSSAGMTMAQEESSAEYPGMPHSAIATGAVDYVCTPEKMPEQLVKYTRHAALQYPPAITPRAGSGALALNKIFVTLRARTEHDFSLYKKNTILRRVERRMNIHQIDHIEDYADYLQESDREAQILFKELLIGVTSFFRDPEAFEALQESVLPRLLTGKPNDYMIRIWVTGCASGEEAYSIAILLHEWVDRAHRRFHVQIFGTDIDADAITVARAGRYPANIASDITPERLHRYFTKEADGSYRVKQNIRGMVVFAPHDLIRDPPFTKLDMICCRNLLIYMGAELQRKLLPMFHYSLKPDGVLFLGSSETVGQDTDLFNPLHRKWRLFQRTPAGRQPARVTVSFPQSAGAQDAHQLHMPDAIEQAEGLSIAQLIESILEVSDTPPCAIITDNCNVVYIHGRIGKFLEPAEGKANVNIIDMARPGIKRELAAAIRQVTLNKQEAACKGLELDHAEGGTFLNLTVRPILQQSRMRGLMMVVFQETATATKKEQIPPAREPDTGRNKSVKELETELHHTRENLQTTIEELETSNEELKSTNEELQSTNEELQSTNEELETSKEELQSLNEESATVNSELQSRIEELSNANDDIRNLLDNSDIATLFLDTDLRIRRFTPRTTEIIPLTSTDAGRPIAHLASTLERVNLMDHCKEVLRDLTPQQMDVTSSDGLYYSLRVRPYRTVTNVIDGVVITFQDITESKHVEQAKDEIEQQYRTLLDLSSDCIMLVDPKTMALVDFNQRTAETLGYTREALEELTLTDIDATGPHKPVATPRKSTSFTSRYRTKDGHIRHIEGTAKAISIAERKLIVTSWHITHPPAEG